MKNEMKVEFFVLVLLISVGAWLRVMLQDLPNVAPVVATTLMAAMYFRRATWALTVPLLTMAISDLFIGSYQLGLMAVVYCMLSLPIACRKILQRHCALDQGAAARHGANVIAALLKFLGCAVVTSTLFFVVTNFSHWWIYHMYPHTVSGLAQCYVQAIPFFRYALVGDIVFATALFSIYAMAHAMAAAGVFRAAR